MSNTVSSEMSRKESLEISRARASSSNEQHLAYSKESTKRQSREYAVSRKARKMLDKSGLNENKNNPAFELGKDWPLILAMMAAGIKDLFDIALLALKALAGTASVLSFGFLGGFLAAAIALGWVISLMAGIFIAMMMLLAGAGEKKKVFKSFLKKFGVLALGTGAEAFIEGLNILPIETLTVVVIIMLTMAERKNIIKIPGEKKEVKV